MIAGVINIVLITIFFFVCLFVCLGGFFQALPNVGNYSEWGRMNHEPDDFSAGTMSGLLESDIDLNILLHLSTAQLWKNVFR